MIYPYEIQGGEIVENKSSYEMQLNALNNKSKTPDFFTESAIVPDVFKSCSCGAVFILVGSINICNDCYDKFDNHSHYLATVKRNKRRNK